MKKIDFKQLKFFLPAVCFFPLLGMGWLVIDLFYSEPQTVVQRKEIPEARMANKFGNLAEWNYTVTSDSIEKYYTSKYSEREKIILKMQYLSDSLEESKREVISDKAVEWKEWNTLDGAVSNMKTGIKKTASFFGDIIEKGAVPVYIKELSPRDSIN